MSSAVLPGAPARAGCASSDLPRSDGALRLTVGLFALALPLSVSAANAGWVLVLVALMLRAWRREPIPFPAVRTAALLPLAVYLAVAALSAALGEDPVRSLGRLNRDAHKLWIHCLLAVALACSGGSGPIGWLAAGFGAAALIGVGQTLLLPPVQGGWLKGEWVRAHAFVHPVTFGQQMAVAALGAACFLLRPPDRAGSRSRVATLALAGLCGAALVLSHTRSAVLGLAAGLAAALAVTPGWRRKVPLALALALLGLGVMETMFARRSLVAEAWRTAQGREADGQSARLTLWKTARDIGLERPLLGVGPGNFRAAFSRRHRGLIDGESTWGDAHNLYLHQFAERGLLGLAALLLLLGVLWARALQRAWRLPRAWTLWSFAATTAFLVMNLTEVSFETELLWMLLLFAWMAGEAEYRRLDAKVRA